jgi:hypothetical protein
MWRHACKAAGSTYGGRVLIQTLENFYSLGWQGLAKWPAIHAAVLTAVLTAVLLQDSCSKPQMGLLGE